MAIRTILEVTEQDYHNGKCTMRETQETLYKAGWFNYLPSEEQVLSLWANSK